MLNENMEFPHKYKMTLKHITQHLVRSFASFRTLKISNVKELNLENSKKKYIEYMLWIVNSEHRTLI